jgi:hypothetical protein
MKMAEMGRYCKAYPVEKFREFGGWKENLQNLRGEKPQGQVKRKGPQNGAQDEAPQAETQRTLAAEDHLYLQENFVVTDGVFIDEHIIFDDVTPEWIDFCENTLGFEVPSYESTQRGASAQ